MNLRILFALMVLLGSFAIVACDDDGGGNDGPVTPTPSGFTPVVDTPPTIGAGPTPNVQRVVERDEGDPWGIEDAGVLLDVVLLRPADVAETGWALTTDTTATNADAVQADPEAAESIGRCGRVLARTMVTQPENLTAAFVDGQTLAYFSMGTVYGSAEGATDCANEGGAALGEPGQLARAFGDLWLDPDAVVVEPFEYPAVGDASFAATLTGQIDVGGAPFPLTVLVVGFRQGNVTGAVGSARSGAVPPAAELAPFVDLVLARIAANQ
jgi:hypothetical protein